MIKHWMMVGGEHLDCEYTDKEMYLLSVTSMEVEGLFIIDNKVLNTRNVTYSEIIKESVMNIDKYY